ncbi:MAG: tetratricopeptide repeat protein [Deltaproteobacteria bacterium]|nr:tetratricopeptide repeat protein [Deltaproteobacteria bacterium]
MTKDRYADLPLVLLLFISFFLGMLLALISFVLTGVNKIIYEWRERQTAKRSIDAKKLYSEAVENIFKGDIAKAQNLLKKSLIKDPQHIDSCLKLAEIYLKDGKTEAARDALGKGLSASPSNPEIIFKLIDVCAAANDRDKTYVLLNNYLEKEPSSLYALQKIRGLLAADEQWHESIGHQKKVVAIIKSGISSEAAGEASSNKLKEEIILLSGSRYEAAKVFCKEEKWSSALEQIEDILKIDNSFVPAHILMGNIFYKQGKPSSAVKVWERAYRKYRHIALFMQLEELYLKESLPSKIIRLYKRTIDFHPDDKRLRLFLARLYLRLEMIDEAIKELEGLSMEGENSRYQNLLIAEAYTRRGRFDKAAAAFKNAIGAKDAVAPLFECRNCNHCINEWKCRCPQCGKYNTLDFNPI